MVDLFNRAFSCVTTERDHILQDVITLTYWFFKDEVDVHRGTLLYSMIFSHLDSIVYGRLISRILSIVHSSTFSTRPIVPIPSEWILGVIRANGTIGKVLSRRRISVSPVK